MEKHRKIILAKYTPTHKTLELFSCVFPHRNVAVWGPPGSKVGVQLWEVKKNEKKKKKVGKSRSPWGGDH